MLPEFNQTPIETPKNHTKIWFLIVLGILLVFLNGWMLYQNYFREKEPIQNLVTTNPTDEFADWKTYRNEEYGFEFKYPEDKFLGSGVVNTNSSGKPGFFLESGMGLDAVDIFPEGEFDAGLPKDDPITEDILIDGKRAKKISWRWGSGRVLKIIKIEDLPKGNWSNSNRIQLFSETQELMLDQILSTFKFISTSTKTIIDMSSWKTYTNTKYGYEFKYPENVGVISDYDSSFIGPPTNPEEDLLLISDKEKTFHFQVSDGKLNRVKNSTLGDQVLSTFIFTK